jgi:hypothetical protein
MKTKNLILLTGAMAFGLAVTLLTGCVSPKAVQQKEALLTSVGFKAVTVATPEQKNLLNTLPSDRLSAITRAGKVYFVYPDPARKVLYVGSNSQYLDYQVKAQTQGLEAGAWDSAFGDWDSQ